MNSKQFYFGRFFFYNKRLFFIYFILLDKSPLRSNEIDRATVPLCNFIDTLDLKTNVNAISTRTLGSKRS